MYSPWEYYGGFRWRLLIFPFGNETNSISVYLDCGGPTTSDPPPEHDAIEKETNTEDADADNNEKSTAVSRWNCAASFWLYMLHSTSLSLYTPVAPGARAASDADIVKNSAHVFSKSAQDWGFLEFCPHDRFVPGDFADEHMNIVFKVRIRMSTSEEVLANEAFFDEG